MLRVPHVPPPSSSFIYVQIQFSIKLQILSDISESFWLLLRNFIQFSNKTASRYVNANAWTEFSFNRPNPDCLISDYF